MAREHPRYANTEWPEYEYREYPKLVYPGASDQSKPYHPQNGKPNAGKVVPSVLVQNEEEEARVMGGEAKLVQGGSPGMRRPETVADERAEALVRAKQLGVKVDARWSLPRILDAIDAQRPREIPV